MKKILLTTVAAAVLASSSAYAMEDMFYVKANAGWSKLNKVQGLKSKNDVFFGVGAGYHVMDNVRVDLTFDHFANPTHKGTKKEGNEKSDTKVKGDINTLMFNGFVDLFDVDAAKVFVGAGVGVSHVNAKYTRNVTGTDAGGNDFRSFASGKSKKTNLTFAGYVGGSYEFTPGVTGDVTYSYRDMGKTKKFEGEGGKSVHYRGHHVGVGVRFDI